MISNRKLRCEALDVLGTIRAVLADQLAATVELRRVLGPLSVGLADALACAVREATGLSVLVNETLKEDVYDSEKEGAQTQGDAAFLLAARRYSGPRRDDRRDDAGPDGGQGSSGRGG